jgi:hypothetical protein
MPSCAAQAGGRRSQGIAMLSPRSTKDRELTAIHRFPVLIPGTAIDANGHANNVEYVHWMQRAAISHSDFAGCTLRQGGWGLLGHPQPSCRYHGLSRRDRLLTSPGLNAEKASRLENIYSCVSTAPSSPGGKPTGSMDAQMPIPNRFRSPSVSTSPAEREPSGWGGEVPTEP